MEANMDIAPSYSIREIHRQQNPKSEDVARRHMGGSILLMQHESTLFIL
jgi:hypothetical protein